MTQNNRPTTIRALTHDDARPNRSACNAEAGEGGTGLTVECSYVRGGGVWERRDAGGDVIEHGRWWTNAFGEHIVRWRSPREDSTGVTQAEREATEAAPTERIALARTIARRAYQLDQQQTAAADGDDYAPTVARVGAWIDDGVAGALDGLHPDEVLAGTTPR